MLAASRLRRCAPLLPAPSPGAAPAQFRELQGSESPEFLQIFPNGVMYLDGKPARSPITRPPPPGAAAQPPEPPPENQAASTRASRKWSMTCTRRDCCR